MKTIVKQILSKQNRGKIGVSLALAILLAAALLDIFHKPALTYLTDISKQGLTYLGAVTGIKVITAMFSLSEGLDQIVTRIMNFFIFSNALLFAQIVILKLSKILLIKAALLITFVLFMLLKSYRTLLLRILILLFFINPGISFYVLGIKYIADRAKLDISGTIENKLTEINKITETGFTPLEEENYTESDTETDTNGENSSTNDFETEEEKTSFISKLKNKFTEVTEKTKEKIKQVQTFSIIKAKELIVKVEELLFSVLQYFVTTIIQFLLLPLLYFYAFYNVLKKMLALLDTQMTFSLEPPETNKIETEIKKDNTDPPDKT